MTAIPVNVGDTHLATYLDGEEGRPWLILSNSLAADSRMWDDQIATLTRTHRVIRYDTRGHGHSPATPGPYSFDLLVSDMVAILDHYGAARADVLSLSLGGMTALGLALAHPDRVGSMIVCDARADAPQPFVDSWDQRIAAIEKGGMQSIVSGTLERWFTPQGHKNRPQAVSLAEDMILQTDTVGYAGCAKALKGLDYLRHLGGLRAPVLYLVGAEDTGAPRQAMAQMADVTPNGRLIVLPDLAHVPNMEDPQAFNAAIQGWLTDAAKVAGQS
ncbi:alpha/beta fold hydrolase [Aureimonas fodinaquatilis]|uniref:Alpha/beta fold hydrolase n=1 Tax=Aureimonas fodinaquatilis TaxID=2565783 RepID=A0A5B0DUU5_9HYPH|nr:alpha/beta fold hydrolase [Aureimonas fodinaquatilis]KAA0969561.1 alpha/beta fold hydrolase [Aureimonas fodinaquatilis]